MPSTRTRSSLTLARCSPRTSAPSRFSVCMRFPITGPARSTGASCEHRPGVPRLGKDPGQDRAGMESVARIQVLRTRRDARDDPVHQSPQNNLVARLARRDLVAERAVGMDRRVLEDVDHVRYLPLVVSPWCERFREVGAAAPMVLHAVIDPVAAGGRPGCEQGLRCALLAGKPRRCGPPIWLGGGPNFLFTAPPGRWGGGGGRRPLWVCFS